MGALIDEEYGGSGGSFLDATLFLEEIARGQIPVGGYGVTLIVVGALNKFGTDEQKQELLGARRAGRRRWRSRCPSPTGLRRGLAQVPRTPRGRRVGPERGEDVVLVRAQGQPRADRLPHAGGLDEARGPVDDPRAARRRGLHDHADPDAGRRGDQRAPPRQRARARVERCSATEGNGWTAADGRPEQRARDPRPRSALGLAQRSFDDALAYAKERKQFGRPVGTFQALQHKFADLATDLAQARLLVRFVARLTDEDPTRMLPQEASMAKLACTELAKRCALEGMQIMGGYGYAKEYPMERYLRAAVVTTIYGGTSEIQKNIIAKTLGL